MTKTECHRTTLSCVVGDCHAVGRFPLEMLSTCTCYSPHVHAIAGCIGDGSGTCHLLIAQHGHLCSCTYLVLTGPRIGSLLFHMSVFYWHTCHVAVGSRVTSSLDHVSYFYWSTLHYHNTPRVFLLLDHVSRCYMFVCQYFIGSHVMP